MTQRHLILGLLMQQPMSGYDIRKYVQTVLSAVTSVNYGTLYPALHKLLDEGSVEVEEIRRENRPVRKVYRITSTGQQELLVWLAQPPDQDQVKREFLLRVYLAQRFMPGQVAGLVAVRRRQVHSEVSTLQTEQASVNDPGQRWLLSYAIFKCRAELDWLDTIEQQNNNHP